MQEENQLELTLLEAADYARVTRQALYVAIRAGKLKAVKRKRWYLTQNSIDDYRKKKYSREYATFNGEKIHDLEEGRWSVLQASKTLSSMLGRPYPPNRLYWLIRRGEIPATKAGSAWVLNKEEVKKLCEREQISVRS